MHKDVKVAFLTLGCKVNQADTDSLAGAFLARGYSVVGFDDVADVYIVNTCTVTNLADSKSRRMIRRAVGKADNPVVVATGCFAQTEGGKLLEEIPGLNVVVGTKDRLRIVDLVEEALASKTGTSGASEAGRFASVGEFTPGYGYEEFGQPSLSGRTRATLKIEDGCEEFCSYCKIPYARGPVRSRDFGRILDEVGDLVDRGYKEIVLTGVHLGHYGKDSGYGRTLADVVEAIADTPGVLRVRTSSVDPTDVTPRLAELVAEHPGVCRHIHIPLQGGHDAILKAMGRKYGLEEYSKVITGLRDLCPGVSITTDIITGFPGETEDQFKASLAFSEAMAFSRMHVFPYSPRTGTPAAGMPRQISGPDKNKRVSELISLSRRMSVDYNKGYVDRVANLLVESFKEGVLHGLTDTYVKVSARVPGKWTASGDGFINELIPVDINDADEDGIYGSLKDNP